MPAVKETLTWIWVYLYNKFSCPCSQMILSKEKVSNWKQASSFGISQEMETCTAYINITLHWLKEFWYPIFNKLLGQNNNSKLQWNEFMETCTGSILTSTLAWERLQIIEEYKNFNFVIRIPMIIRIFTFILFKRKFCRCQMTEFFMTDVTEIHKNDIIFFTDETKTGKLVKVGYLS